MGSWVSGLAVGKAKKNQQPQRRRERQGINRRGAEAQSFLPRNKLNTLKKVSEMLAYLASFAV
jgi:hypothetical protein